MAWSGLGVNYKSKQQYWDEDIAYFKSIGLTGIRPHMNVLPYPWSAGSDTESIGSYGFFRLMSKYFIDRGFWVTWGPACMSGHSSAGSMSLTDWNNYHDSVVAEAAYLQSQGIILGCFELANELDSKFDGVTITSASSVALFKALASDVKAVYSGPVGVSLWDYNNTTYDAWIAGGDLGALDYIGIHPYGSYGALGKAFSYSGFTVVKKMYDAFGDKCIITEFGPDGNLTQYQLIPEDLKTTGMRKIYKVIKNIRFPRAMVYTWTSSLNADDQFCMKLMDGSTLDCWEVLASDNKRVSKQST